mmetsp:Transcript_66979/g.135793  ORF Transcript_66979/g.135793 Transcript_66979/m.135793 type:complete len:178 (-) Transcript_66979:124-657(-)
MFRRLAARAFLVPQHRFARVQRVCVSKVWNPPCLGCQATPLSTMSDEAAKAEEVEAPKVADEVTLFDKIVAGDIPCDKIYEDDVCIAFNDIAPVAPTHFLVIPKNRDGLSQLSKAEERHKELLGHLMWAASKIANDQGLGEDGFRVVINDGKQGCQSVYHLHIHVIGGKKLSWPPGV